MRENKDRTAMITTSQVPYPVLLAGKFGKFGFRANAAELVERSESLRLLNQVDWLKLVDRDFNFYRMTNLKAIRGYGRWGGYFLEGPFLSRRIVYQADLLPLKKLELEDVAELLLEFMRSAQGFRESDEQHFKEKFAEISSNMRSIEDVRVFFENLRWGDSSDEQADLG